VNDSFNESPPRTPTPVGRSGDESFNESLTQNEAHNLGTRTDESLNESPIREPQPHCDGGCREKTGGGGA
jgi:hypothetical protein